MEKSVYLENSSVVFKMYLLRQENDLSLIAQVVVAYGIDKYIIEGIQTYKSEDRIYYISNDTYDLVA